MRALLAALGEPQRALPGDPRRRHERQDVDDADVRGAAPRRRADASARTSRRTCAAGPSGSRSTASTSTSSARSRASGRTRTGATQFEVLTAAALAEFAAREVDVAVVEAGLGGRLDATNVLDARGRRADERRARPHRRARRDARGDRGREARGRSRPAPSSCSASRSGRPRPRARRRSASTCSRARTSASPSRPPRRSSAGRVDPHAAEARAGARPARAPRRASARDLGRRAQHRRRRLSARPAAARAAYVVVASILADKNVDAMLRALSAVGDTLRRDALHERARARRPRSSPRARHRISRHVEAVADPARGARARPRARRPGRRGPRHRLALPPCRAFVVRIETVR